MPNQSRKKIISIPLCSDELEQHVSFNNIISSVFESIYWQTTGWVLTPQSLKIDYMSNLKFKTPRSIEKSENQIYTKKSTEPKLQIENKVPYGVLPKDVVVEIEKRRFAQQDLESILLEMDIETQTILPFSIIYKDKVVIIRKEYYDDIPQGPFLDLHLFDDNSYYDSRSPEEWLILGNTENGRKPLPAFAFVPEQVDDVDTFPSFHWHDVSILDYDAGKKLYLIRKFFIYQEKSDSVHNTNDSMEMWIHRIYIKFDAEEPLSYAKRLQNAIVTRHFMEESLRMSYYVDCMPMVDAPDWSQLDLAAIKTKVRRSSRQFQTKLKWTKDHLEKCIEEITLSYKRTFNYSLYKKIAKQAPCLMQEFKNIDINVNQSHRPGFLIHLDCSIKYQMQNFLYNTLYTTTETIRALTHVESNILALQNMSLYNLPLNDVYTLDKFEALQNTELKNIENYIHQSWIPNISNGILSNFEKSGKGDYDLNQTVLHTFKLTKLGKLLKMVRFKMQDVIRYLVVKSLETYATTIQEACESVSGVKDYYKWDESLSSNKFSPSKKPMFEVPLEIKGDRLQFVVNMEKYGAVIRNLFQEGLKVTKNLPRIEKYVMKKMLFNPDDKLDSVGEKEKQIVRWHMDIVQGINCAINVATAYIRAYDAPLTHFKMDQINYVKQFARKKATCDLLKQIIEMHNDEKKKLENTIPSFVDIGPFRLMTQTVQAAAIKKHEQLAEGVLNHFYDKLNQVMESIKDQFLVLHDRIRQPTGNIEDLLDKKQWCHIVPKKIETLSVEVNRLRSDMRLISMFHRNMDDDDFNTFWQIQEFPQISMKILQNRISTFDMERHEHREHLISDIEQLKNNLNQLKVEINFYTQYSDINKAAELATKIRKARKNIINYEEQCQLYQKRERLFGLQITQYPEIAEMSNLLIPFESFWLSIADFYKYKDRNTIDLLSIEPLQLKEAIEEFHLNLQDSLLHFTQSIYPEIHISIISALSDVEEFMHTTLP